MKTHMTTVGKTDIWITPKYILDALGEFDLDPCANHIQPWPTAKHEYTEMGLEKPWFGRVWCNPPFNRYVINDWMAKMADHNNGILLTGGALETGRFKDHVYGKASGILALNHRPYFYRPDGTKGDSGSGQIIVLVAYGKDNFRSCIESGLGQPLTIYKQAFS